MSFIVETLARSHSRNAETPVIPVIRVPEGRGHCSGNGTSDRYYVTDDTMGTLRRGKNALHSRSRGWPEKTRR